MNLTGYAKLYSEFFSIILKLQDWLVIILCGIGTFFFLEPDKNFPAYDGFMPHNYLTALVIAFLLSAWWFPSFNVYKSWRGESIYEETRTIFFGWSSSILGLIVFLVFTKTTETFSRHWIGLWFITAFLLLMLSRIALRFILRSLRKKGLNRRYIVLVGAGDISQQVANKITSATWMGLHIKGFFSDETNLNKMSGIKNLGNLDAIINYIENNQIDQVWLTLPLKEMDKIERLSHQLSQVAVNVMLIPDISSLRMLNHAVSQFDGLPIIDISVTPMVGANIIIKWLEDKIMSLIILMIISPLMLVIALAVQVSSKGPILYRQERISWNGKSFQMLKFRTMPVNSEESIVWGQAKKKKKTRGGEFLRKTSLDELPQFINVLKGDMSIVGPRPERTVFVDQFKNKIDRYMQKHMVQAGITGWAQINGFRGDTCLKTRIEYDLFYVENWSLWFDLKIIGLTVFKALKSVHAY